MPYTTKPPHHSPDPTKAAEMAGTVTAYVILIYVIAIAFVASRFLA